VGEKKEFFTLREVKGPAENPAVLVLQLGDSEEPISISKERAFQRVDGYTVDLRYTLENRTFPARRVGDKIKIAGEDYIIVAITQNEVVLSAPNGKKYTRPYNPGP
jgi:hypothetical protein